MLPREALITICKAFARPHLDYGDSLFDQTFNASSHEKLESIQYSPCLALTGTIRGTFKQKLYQELGLESLQLCCWHRKLWLFIRLSSINLQFICLILSLQETHIIHLETIIRPVLISSTFFSKILSFHWS